jgi:hypothetical protein
MKPTSWITLVLVGLAATTAWADPPLAAPERPVLDGIRTTRLVPGAPYELAGSRIVFTNWYYIQPGDLDWRDATGKSVYVEGSSGVFEAEHVGINAPHGIRIVAEKPRVLEPFFRPHRMILKDGDLFKGWTDSDYYESRDAMRWERKAGLEAGVRSHDGFYQIFIDPAGPKEERFKAVWTDEITRAQFEAFRKQRPDGWEPRALLHLGERDQVACLRGGVSADGIHWNTLPDPIVVEYCDTWNTAYYDASLREYVLFTRNWSIGPRSDRLPPDIRGSWTGVGRRAIGRSSSRDFRRFPPSTLILEPTPDMLPSEQLYTNCYTTIPGAPDQHLMFPTLWNGSRDDTTRILLASSHDGQVWHWVPGGDLLHTSPFGNWDGGCVWATPNLLELPNGDWVLPYIANNVPHKYPRGQRTSNTSYAVWPRGRMVALEAEDEGEFTTIPMIPPGKKLVINAVTLRTGWVKIAVLGVEGHGLTDCTPIVGDRHGMQVTWRGGDDLGTGERRPVTLRIALKQARIYGLEFR